MLLFHPSGNGQSQFECLTEDTPDPFGGSTGNFNNFNNGDCDLTGLTEEDYALLAPYTVFVNFHFMDDAQGDNFHFDPNGDPNYYAPHIVDEILWRANSYFEDPPLNELSPDAGEVPDSRIRWVLYTEPGNPNDPHGGIFTHPRNFNLVGNFIDPDDTEYGGRVLNITVRDQNFVNENTDPGAVTVTGSAGTVGGNWSIFIGNVHWHYFYEEINPWDYARSINHELGHIFNLPHSFSCHNDCYDMDNSVECGGPSCTVNPNTGPCPIPPPSDCNPSWGGRLNCCYCTWGQGNNFMGYNGDFRAMTPCQWETMFERILRDDPIWDWGSFCHEEAPPLNITNGQNIVWDQTRLLNRDVVIESGASLEINCTVMMGAGKRIVVRRGGKLIVNKGTITNLCDERWAGIAVHGNTNKAQPDPFGTQESDDAGIVILSTARIMNASNAITTQAPGWPWPSSADYYGGVIHAENSEFINNGRAVEFMKYDFPNKSQFIDCIFTEEPTHDGNTIGITIWDCDGINFELNRFENLDGTAIYGIDYSIRVANDNHFINCQRGIELLSTYPFSTAIEVTDNYFSGNNYHIITNAAKGRAGINIYDNTFENSLFGIWLEGNTRFTVVDNNFDNNGWGIANWQTGTFSNRIQNNSFNNAFLGINARGDNSGVRFQNNCFDQIDYNINIGNIAQNLGKVAPIQSTGTASADNCFSPGNFIDIRSPQDQTESFIYYAPQTPGDLCLVPTNNLSDNGVNNYTVQLVQNTEGACLDGIKPGDGDGKLTKDELAQLEAIMIQNSNISNGQPGSAGLLLTYQNSQIAYHDGIRSLMAQYFADGNFVEIEGLLTQSPLADDDRNLIGVKMMQNEYLAAQSLLNAYPVTIPEDQDFKDIEAINLDRLQQGAGFVLTAQQEVTLKNLADNPKNIYRGYAAAILSFVLDQPYPVFQSDPLGFSSLESESSAVAPNAYKVFPNPGNQYVNIEFPPLEDENAMIECKVFNTNGQLSKTIELGHQEPAQIDVSDLPEGIYWIELNLGESRVHLQKYVIIR